MSQSTACALRDRCRAALDAAGRCYSYFSLAQLQKETGIALGRVPATIRIVLESVLRNCDGTAITEDAVTRLAKWTAQGRREETPFVVSRVLLQDLTGVPLLVDIASMREAARERGIDPHRIEPLVPVDLVVDHSVMIDKNASPTAHEENMKIEFSRNRERYGFLKWGMQAFKTFGIVPPGFGICHQVNLEHLARGVFVNDDGLVWPDSVVGTDSHTVMVNGLGIIGWGVGGIEAEAAMLGRPIYMLAPDVVGVHLTGTLSPECTTTDLALYITQALRARKVVGKFVEFFGLGAASLAVPERATIANMAPEYGATMGYFAVDEKTIDYLRQSARSPEQVELIEKYFKAQGLFGIPRMGDIEYTDVVEIDLGKIRPSIAGPRKPQERIELSEAAHAFKQMLVKPVDEGGLGVPASAVHESAETRTGPLSHGDIVIAAITSCTNTSNPSVLLGAGLLAKKAVEKGLKVHPRVKTSLAPGSRVVTEYLKKTGLLPYLEKLGFSVAAYGCTTCIGNAGTLTDDVNEAIRDRKLAVTAVLSGNRNFEARIHPLVRANFLASPALVVAYAIAGSMNVDLTRDPLGQDVEGNPITLEMIWPTPEEIKALMPAAQDPKTFEATYIKIKTDPGELWQSIDSVPGPCYNWPKSTYIERAPFFDAAAPLADITGARALGIYGDSVTTDHISPAGRITPDSAAADWLHGHGVEPKDFNSFGSRRGNHEVMMRGAFANVRIKNLMVPLKDDGTRVEGGWTVLQPEGRVMRIFEASREYIARGTPSIVFGGEEYGTGSSRDWAAKGTKLLGVKAVIVKSFERIHRSNLVGMGVLPLEFLPGEGVEELGITGAETFDIKGLETLEPQGHVTLVIHRPDGTTATTELKVRVDTPVELTYLKANGILPFMLERIAHAA